MLSSLTPLSVTDKIPTAETKQSRACTTRGNTMNPVVVVSGKPTFRAMDPPRIMALMISAAIDSNKSAPRALQSPTLSPTRSAITAGFRGSSSGIPASTLPTKSAPTSAALVKMPVFVNEKCQSFVMCMSKQS